MAVGCANADMEASTPIALARIIENMLKLNPLLVSIVLLRQASQMIGSSATMLIVSDKQRGQFAKGFINIITGVGLNKAKPVYGMFY